MAKKHMHAVWVGSLLGVTAVFTRMSFASTLPQFYIISFIQGFFTTSAAMLPVNIVLTNWFRKRGVYRQHCHGRLRYRRNGSEQAYGNYDCGARMALYLPFSGPSDSVYP